MVLPYDTDPSLYSWPVKDCSILLIDTGFLSIDDVEKIAYCLLCADAVIVSAILANNQLVVYPRGAE